MSSRTSSPETSVKSCQFPCEPHFVHCCTDINRQVCDLAPSFPCSHNQPSNNPNKNMLTNKYADKSLDIPCLISSTTSRCCVIGNKISDCTPITRVGHRTYFTMRAREYISTMLQSSGKPLNTDSA